MFEAASEKERERERERREKKGEREERESGVKFHTGAKRDSACRGCGERETKKRPKGREGRGVSKVF